MQISHYYLFHSKSPQVTTTYGHMLTSGHRLWSHSAEKHRFFNASP